MATNEDRGFDPDRLNGNLQKLTEAYKQNTRAQGRQRRVVVGLTVVLAVAAGVMAWTTWKQVLATREANEIQRQQVEATREANEIQRQALERQKANVQPPKPASRPPAERRVP